jgi:uncharacterized protein DUF2484|tara:strand:+ start:10487 stop:10984 length:498 start_codon:yes stop_codon:yes gene_type:complete
MGLHPLGLLLCYGGHSSTSVAVLARCDIAWYRAGSDRDDRYTGRLDLRASRFGGAFVHVPEPLANSVGKIAQGKPGGDPMTLSLVLACFWAVVANILAMTSSTDNHWRHAYGLIIIGIPILGYVTMQHGPWLGLLVLAAGCSVLRWPVVHLMRWVRLRSFRGPAE